LLCTGGGDQPIESGSHRIRPILCTPRSLPVLWRLNPLGSFPYWTRTIREHAAEADAVISLSPVMAVATRRALPHTPVLYCPTVLDRAEHPHARASVLQWFEKLAMRRAHALLFPAKATRDAAASLYGPLRRPSCVRPLGIDRDDIAAAGRSRRDLGIPADARLLLTIGLVNQNKGQLQIAEALRLLSRRDWIWAVIGDGPGIEAVRTVIREAGLDAQVRFVGSDAPIGDWLAAAAALIACSRIETFGLAIAEALSCGVPVVLPRSRSDGNPARTTGWALSPLADAVRDNGLGLTFERGDAASLAGAVSALLHDATERRAMSARSAAYADSQFRWDRYAAAAIELLARHTDVEPPTGLYQTDDTPAAPPLQLAR
jgi:glycosyltransferase involved in cell wall biosynthesis